MSTDNKFTIYWLNGEKSVISGPTIEDAFTNAGYGAGAISAVDFYDYGESDTHHYDKEKHTWVSKKPLI